MNHDPPQASRRRFMRQGAALIGTFACAPSLTLDPAAATPQRMRAAIKQVVGEAVMRKGKLKLDLPPLIENGNAVPLAVSGESPMTEADHIRAIHVFTEKNPQPNVASFHLGPRAGRASISTRIRLADSQKIIAVAEMSDGSFWSEEADVVVTLPACAEG
jgi:sulfur-oxidizing protein SoxY